MSPYSSDSTLELSKYEEILYFYNLPYSVLLAKPHQFEHQFEHAIGAGLHQDKTTSHRSIPPALSAAPQWHRSLVHYNELRFHLLIHLPTRPYQYARL